MGAERRAVNWDIRATLRVCVVCRARFSFRVSWSLRRRRRTDSGVGAEGEMGSSRFCLTNQSGLICRKLVGVRCGMGTEYSDGCVEKTYLIMTQPHPRRQIIRYSQDTPQRIYFKFIKRFVNSRLQQCFQLVHAIFYLRRGFRVFPIVARVRY